MKMLINKWWVITSVVLAGIIIMLTVGSYQPPLLDDIGRNPLEVIRDFFAFGWHFSRHVWWDHSRDWKNSNRQRLLAYWYNPDFDGFADLRDKSLFELGCSYERLSLPDRASEIFLRACRQNPKDRWLIRRTGDRMLALKKWKKLEELSQLLLSIDGEDQQAMYWRKESKK